MPGRWAAGVVTEQLHYLSKISTEQKPMPIRALGLGWVLVRVLELSFHVRMARDRGVVAPVCVCGGHVGWCPLLLLRRGL